MLKKKEKNKSKSKKKRTVKLSKVCNVVAMLLFVVTIYTTISNVLYVNNYAASYGTTIWSMWQDALSYLISGFVPNFSYGFIIFVLGKFVAEYLEKDTSDNEAELEEATVSEEDEE